MAPGVYKDVAEDVIAGMGMISRVVERCLLAWMMGVCVIIAL